MFTPRVTIIFATIARPACARRFILSVRRRYPDIAIVVADQDERNESTEAFYQQMSVKAVYTGDVGVAAARNRAVEAVETEFVWLCDDDFILISGTDLSVPLEIFDSEATVRVVGGIVFNVSDYHKLNRSRVHDWQRYFYLDQTRRCFHAVGVERTFYEATRLNDILYIDSDVVLNWAVFRRDVFDAGQRWDERFICNGEHEDFYLSLKVNHKARVVYAPQFFCLHHSPFDPDYGSRRSANEGWAEFGKKWGVDQYWDSMPLARRFDDWEHGGSTRNLISRIRTQLPATPRTALISRVDDDGTIDLSDLRDELESLAPGFAGARAVRAVVNKDSVATAWMDGGELGLPRSVFRAVAKAWKRPWKRVYLRILLRVVGIKIRDDG